MDKRRGDHSVQSPRPPIQRLHHIDDKVLIVFIGFTLTKRDTATTHTSGVQPHTKIFLQNPLCKPASLFKTWCATSKHSSSRGESHWAHVGPYFSRQLRVYLQVANTSTSSLQQYCNWRCNYFMPYLTSGYTSNSNYFKFSSDYVWL